MQFQCFVCNLWHILIIAFQQVFTYVSEAKNPIYIEKIQYFWFKKMMIFINAASMTIPAICAFFAETRSFPRQRIRSPRADGPGQPLVRRPRPSGAPGPEREHRSCWKQERSAAVAGESGGG